jgi:NADH-quinone oxidoreductase subunit M
MELVPAVFPFIPLSIILPLLGIALIVLLEEKFAKWIALVFSGAVLVLSLVSLLHFDFSQAQKVQFYQSITLIKELKLSLSFGADGLSYLMYILTTLVSFVAICWSIRDHQINYRLKEYYAWFLLSESALVGVFTSWDMLVFYVFYELTLVPHVLCYRHMGLQAKALFRLQVLCLYLCLFFVFTSGDSKHCGGALQTVW